MSGLTRWEPFTRWSPLKELEEMEKRLSSYFGHAPATAGGEKKEAITVTEWSPLVDITEDDKEYLVKAEIPEMKKEDIKVNVHDDVLTITHNNLGLTLSPGPGERGTPTSVSC